ncbi:MAG: transposase [Acidimicrobiales bacterium]
MRDVIAAVGVFDGTGVTDVWLVEHLEFMVLIAGQDVIEGDDGVFRIARQVAPDRVISTVDREARHGHKSKSRRFDGFKAHIAEDPDGEIITDVVVTPANTPDADALDDLLTGGDNDEVKPVIYGDAGYGGADVLERLDEAGYEFVIKVPSPSRRQGRWSKADFGVDIDNDTVTCPAGITVAISYSTDGSGAARFGTNCDSCPLREMCTTAQAGRTITIHRREDILQTQRFTQTTDPDWAADYTGTRPKVERKLAHLIRQPWGGRKGRMRGAARIAGDLIARAATINLARLANQGLTQTPNGWAVNPP